MDNMRASTWMHANPSQLKSGNRMKKLHQSGRKKHASLNKQQRKRTPKSTSNKAHTLQTADDKTREDEKADDLEEKDTRPLDSPEGEPNGTNLSSLRESVCVPLSADEERGSDTHEKKGTSPLGSSEEDPNGTSLFSSCESVHDQPPSDTERAKLLYHEDQSEHDCAAHAARMAVGHNDDTRTKKKRKKNEGDKNTQKVCAYTITFDGNFAPCIEDGHLTLALCKPQIRERAELGDYVVAFASTAKANDAFKGKGGNLVYVAQITDRSTVVDYHSGADGGDNRKDRIYDVDANGELQHKGKVRYHKELEKQKEDAKGHVLFSTEFVHWKNADLPSFDALTKEPFNLRAEERDAIRNLNRNCGYIRGYQPTELTHLVQSALNKILRSQETRRTGDDGFAWTDAGEDKSVHATMLKRQSVTTGNGHCTWHTIGLDKRTNTWYQLYKLSDELQRSERLAKLTSEAVQVYNGAVSTRSQRRLHPSKPEHTEADTVTLENGNQVPAAINEKEGCAANAQAMVQHLTEEQRQTLFRGLMELDADNNHYDRQTLGQHKRAVETLAKNADMNRIIGENTCMGVPKKEKRAIMQRNEDQFKTRHMTIEDLRTVRQNNKELFDQKTNQARFDHALLEYEKHVIAVDFKERKLYNPGDGTTITLQPEVERKHKCTDALFIRRKVTLPLVRQSM